MSCFRVVRCTDPFQMLLALKEHITLHKFNLNTGAYNSMFVFYSQRAKVLFKLVAPYHISMSLEPTWPWKLVNFESWNKEVDAAWLKASKISGRNTSIVFIKELLTKVDRYINLRVFQ